MNFAQLHEALRLEILRRIEGDKLTGKLLAQLTGMKQPHISNFLNRRRMLSMQGMDRILAALNLRVNDLLPGGIASQISQPEANYAFEIVPVVSQATAIHNPRITGRDVIAALPLPRGTLAHLPIRSASSRSQWERFVAIRVTAAQALEMQPVLRPHAVLLIDRHYISLARRKGETPCLYAVNTGVGLAVRYVMRSSNRLILRCFSHLDPVALLEPPPGRSAMDLVVGRVCLVLARI
jgi:transcriptional regulator with XRE-family HTH domain